MVTSCNNISNMIYEIPVRTVLGPTQKRQAECSALEELNTMTVLRRQVVGIT